MILCRWCQVEKYDRCLLRELNIQGKCSVDVPTAVSDLIKFHCPTCHESRVDLSQPCEHCGDID